MKSRSIFAIAILFALVGSAFAAPQQGPGRGPIAAARDPELEKQSTHSLEVARYYFYRRKPEKNDKDGWARLNKAVEDRLTEIMDTNPTFAKMDEVFFLMGELYHRSQEPEKAVNYWDKVVKEFPDSQFAGDAKKRLAESSSKPKSEKKG